MANDDDRLTFIFSKKYLLSERVLNERVEELEKLYGFPIVCFETEEGYVFKDENYGIPIGDLFFNKTFGEYNRMRMYPGAIDEVRDKMVEDYQLERARQAQARKEERAKKRRRKFALQVGAIGIALTVGGTAALMGMGIIDSPFKPHEPVAGPVQIDEEPKLNTLSDCNDVILISWLNYAMGQVQDMCDGSEYEYFETLSQEVYTEHFAPAMSAYYDYLDYKEMGLPLFPEYGDRDLVGEAHDRFRGLAMDFARYLENSTYFNKITFKSSPYANAIVTDENGNVLQDSTKVKGELVDVEGKAISAVDHEGVVNVKLSEIDTPYTMNNLPGDAKIFNGDVYVSAKHMYEDFGTVTK